MIINNKYIAYIDDIGENKGGYYCQVYTDEQMNDEIDNFCIYSKDLEKNNDIEYWIKEHLKK